MPFTQYLKSLRENLRTGQAGEHAHRPAFKSLLESLGGDIQAVNEPTQVAVGAPDFLVKRGAAPLGYIECKDIGANLDEVERTEQLKRYLAAFPNLILTDYLEFRWYREAELCRAERLGRLTPDRSDVKRDSEGVVQVQELLEGFFTAEPIAVGTAQELARYMAAKAKQLRDNAQRVLSQEGELGSLHALHQAFRETLIHDLDADQFADMYAQ
ncbi:MAG: DNA methyltransferase, partial [Armatimonadetes bacterium]|nr:DNA methyltransferase [Armatimonadota bacterium]